jgi:hypothetical protein
MTMYLRVSASDVCEWDTKLSATDRWGQGAVGASDRRSRLGGHARVHPSRAFRRAAECRKEGKAWPRQELVTAPLNLNERIQAESGGRKS